MNTLMDKLRNRRDSKEKGNADIIVTLFLTPIILFLFFSIINVSLWLNAKAGVEAAARDGVRVASMWGGTSKNVRLNNTGQSIDTLIKNRIYDSTKKSCKNSLCSQAPVVKCRVGSISGSKVVATGMGQAINCQVTYYYKPVVGFDPLFGTMTSKPISYTISSVSETGYK